MKKIAIYMMCAGMALTTISCANDDETISSQTGENLVAKMFYTSNVPSYTNDSTLKANTSATRTTLNADLGTVTWNANDQISIGYKGAHNKATKPFTTNSTGTSARFEGMADNFAKLFFMMYPYQETTKIEHKNDKSALYTYTMPKKQTAIAGTFDPKANISVGIIPNEKKPFVAYNVGGLLKFSFQGANNVTQVKIINRGEEPIAGEINNTISFNADGTINQTEPVFVQDKSTTIITFAPASGFLTENANYFVALPEGKLASGITLAFVLSDGKVVQRKVSDVVDIKRAKIFNLGNINLNTAKAKQHLLVNLGLIDVVNTKVAGLQLEADGTLDIYREDNLEKILSYKGVLEANNNDKLTSLDELQYYRNVTGLMLRNNKNLAGAIDLSKFPQLNGKIVIEGSPLVTNVNIKGLNIFELSAHHLNGMKTVTVGNNPKLKRLEVRHNDALEAVDASNLPELDEIAAYYSPKIQTINITNSPKLKRINAHGDVSLERIIGLENSPLMEDLTLSRTGIKQLDVSKNTKVNNINLMSSKIEELTGLEGPGASLITLQVSATALKKLDVTSNTNLTTLELAVTQVEKLDVSKNTKLINLRAPFTLISEFNLGDISSLKKLNVSHGKLTSIDISKLVNLEEVYLGSQSPSNILQNIQATMTTAQYSKFGSRFKESALDEKSKFEDTNAYVKAIVK